MLPAHGDSVFSYLKKIVTNLAGYAGQTSAEFLPEHNDSEFDLIKKIVENTDSLGGGGGAGGGSTLPSQTGNSGRFLTTNGTDPSWAVIAGGGNALTANPLSQFAATTSVQLRGVISDPTGTGAAVFATSPTLVTPVLGVAAATTLGVGTGATAPATELHVASSLTTSPRGIMSAQYSTTTDGARLHLQKGRGTIASPSVVVTADTLGSVIFSGYDGANYLEMAAINVTAVGTVASTRVPTQMTFQTATNAAPSVLTTRLTISEAGLVTVAGTLAAANFQVSSQAYVANSLAVGASANPSSTRFQVTGAISAASWTTSGVLTKFDPITATNTSAGSATYATATAVSIGQMTLAATNTSVVTTNAAVLYVAGDVIQGTNQTLTNSWGLWNVGKTRLDGAVQFGNTSANGTTAAVFTAASAPAGAATAIQEWIVIRNAAGTTRYIPCW